MPQAERITPVQTVHSAEAAPHPPSPPFPGLKGFPLKHPSTLPQGFGSLRVGGLRGGALCSSSPASGCDGQDAVSEHPSAPLGSWRCRLFLSGPGPRGTEPQFHRGSTLDVVLSLPFLVLRLYFLMGPSWGHLPKKTPATESGLSSASAARAAQLVTSAQPPHPLGAAGSPARGCPEGYHGRPGSRNAVCHSS